MTILFRDLLKTPIEGLSVRIKAGTGAHLAPAWVFNKHELEDEVGNAAPIAASEQASTAPAPVVENSAESVTDKDGYAGTIYNAARNQPIDILVKNRHGEYVLKATVTPTKDISAFTVSSPEVHIETVTRLTPREAMEQDLNIPIVKPGEVMTIERLVRDLGPYIGVSQVITEQGKVKKDFPEKHKETTTDEKTGKSKTTTRIEHHYKVVEDGKPRTILLNLLGSRLNHPKPETFSEDQYKYMATKLDVEVAAIKALVMQECSGIPFEANGLPKLRYERHAFYDLLRKRHESEQATAQEEAKQNKKEKVKSTPFKNPYPQFPNLCNPKRGGFGADGLHQYERFVKAAELDFDFSIQACSWGGFQILATEYAACGCATSFEFANKFMSGSDGQMNIFILFMQNVKKHGVKALRAHDWEDVAAAYNGKGWKIINPSYAKDLKEFYDKFK
ncbi:N-acetylmuramidase family protein [Paraburkholderia sp. Ac-20347]|uniref:N-acetylmuramidase family protein n=1 Tax=Paraburkholderia sp. Ac-20347 TaxID=2703892 RepID=UPI003217177A